MNSSKHANFSLNPANLNGGGNVITGRTNLYLYKVQNIQDSDSLYDINTAPELLRDTALFNFVHTNGETNFRYESIKPLEPGYYVLAVRYRNGVQNFARLTYPSDPYTCPYNPLFPDVFQNFQPCVSSATSNTTTSQPGFPCTSFDSVTLQCITCFDGFVLINGTCTYNDTCPDRQYFHFGKCLNVSDNCDTYENFTGFCLTCRLNDSSIVSGACIPNPVICANRQVVINRTCVNVSDLCKTFDSSTGLCTECIPDYEVNQDGSCSLIPVVCLENQYQLGRTCVNIPAECVQFDKTRIFCDKCKRGYWPSSLGVCLEVVCPPRQVPSEFGMYCL